MNGEQPTYQSYLLRLWRADGDGEPLWRAALEDTLSGERFSFATIEALVGFLRGLMGEAAVEREQAAAG